MSLAIIADRILIAQDAPWALDINVFSDTADTVPVPLALIEAWIYNAGAQASAIYCVSGDGESFIAANTGAIRPTQAQLATLQASSLYIETRWRDASGNVGRADFTGARLIAGQGQSRAGDQALGCAYDVQFAATTGDSAVLGLVGGPMGPVGPEGPPGIAAADTINLSADAQAQLTALKLPAVDVESAILALANALKALTGETPEQETIFSTT